MRIETDDLGEVVIPDAALWGVHTERALANFPLSGRAVHPAMVRAFGVVKLACVRTNRDLGAWADDPAKADAIEQACREMAEGGLLEHVPVDALQGGAGTSTNLCVNEVLANRALALLGHPPGSYERVSPLDDLNLHQSTNDTYPTALRIAAIRGVRALDGTLVALQEAFQTLERRFADVVKVGRTEYQDAVLTTLGREMGAYAEAFHRDRWRVYKCEERLRVVNLGGTAIGTGLGAPRRFVFGAVEALRHATGLGLARAENLVEATQNADVFAEVSGILKACATSLWKVSSDLRLLSSGPDAGLGEIRLPALQAGSSIMPGKVNPVLPEAVTQVAMKVMANDVAIGLAVANGSLELNPFLPLVADLLLESLDLLARACDLLRRRCVEGITTDEARCRARVESATATVTALLPALGYERAAEVARLARASGRSVRDVALHEGGLTEDRFVALVSPEAVQRLGSPEEA
jgi:aspartate ammonia-lyase